MLIALKETIRRIVRGPCRNINWLDGAIALILLLAAGVGGVNVATHVWHALFG